MIVVWAILAFFVGISTWLVVPLAVAWVLGPDWQDRISDRYIQLAQTCAQRSAIVSRDADVTLVAKRYDADHKGDKDSASGDPRHHYDHLDVVGRLRNKILGIATTERDSYISPLLADIGERAKRAKEKSRLGPNEGKFVDGIHVPREPRLVDIDDAKHLTTGSAEPEDGQEAYKKTQISQEGFHERLSFGQGILLIMATLGAMALAWFGSSQTLEPPAANETTISLLAVLAGGRLDDLGPIGTAAAIVGTVAVGFPVLALVLEGVLAFVIFVLVMVAAASLPVWLILLGPSLPAAVGLPLARGMWILAQMTVGRGVLVERSSGQLEHRKLRRRDGTDTAAESIADITVSVPEEMTGLSPSLQRETAAEQLSDELEMSVTADDVERHADGEFGLAQSIREQLRADRSDDDSGESEARYWARLADGTETPIHGQRGDLYRFAWAPLGFAAEKTAANMERLTEPIDAAATDGGFVQVNDTRADWQPVLRVPEGDQWLVTLPQLWQFCFGSSESQSVRQGRDKALQEHGGQQQIGLLVFALLMLAGVAIGGTIGLVAGGAIP